MDIHTRAEKCNRPWTNDTPLPTTSLQAQPKLQHWHQFQPTSQQWTPAQSSNHISNSGDNCAELSQIFDSDLRLLTWNIDGTSPQADNRISEIITFITQLHQQPDIIFFQEVSQSALQQIMTDKRIRQFWFSSEGEKVGWETRPFIAMTLLSTKRFALPNGQRSEIKSAVLGRIWRVAYPSHFNRDALCCDVFIPTSGVSCPTRLRLINVHLDSLPIRPSYRPQQLSIVSSLLQSAGRGVVAGDFNPVLDEDASLVESNGLIDVWTALRPGEPGYTWGTDGKQRYPPNRLDKVAVFGVEARDIQVLELRSVGKMDEARNNDGPQLLSDAENVPRYWSDHHPLLCSFRIRQDSA